MPKTKQKPFATVREELALQQQQVRAAIALAIISAPQPFPTEKTVSIDSIIEEVRLFLGITKRELAKVARQVRQAIMEWVPFGWIIHDEKKKCLTLKKEAEKSVEEVATSYVFG